MVEIQIYDKEFFASLKVAREKISDFRIPFRAISISWFKSNKAIFSLKGPGKYEDLKASTKKQKQRLYGRVYPILYASGFLMDSMVNPNSSWAVNRASKTELILGTTVQWAKWLQTGTRKMVARPPILLGAEQVAPDEISKRRDNWIKIIEDYVYQVGLNGLRS